MDNNNFSSIQLDALKEVSNIGVGNAATAMSALLATKIDMTVPSVNIVKLENLIDDAGEAEVAGIIVRVLGDIPGNILIVFQLDVAYSIISMLTGKIEEEISEMGSSVLCEIGNILCGNYMNAISQVTRLNVTPSVPAIACDMMGAILATTFIEAGQYEEYILDIETVFLNDLDSDIGIHFYYIPVPGSLEKILKSIGIN
jgi:chemotaxis protein CheC